MFNAFLSKTIKNSKAWNDKKFIFKLNELDTGSEILTRRLILVLNWRILSAKAQAYLDMVEKKQAGRKFRKTAEITKRKSARARFLSVQWRRTTKKERKTFK